MDFDLQQLKHALPGVDVRVLGTVQSTQQVARDLVEDHEIHPPGLIVAHRQTQGRGRGSRHWHTDTGSLALTLTLHAPQNHAPQELPLRTGLALRRALEPWICSADLQIKWPNDLLANHRKIAGILCERRQGMDLIGIGLNINVDIAKADPSLQTIATSLHKHLRNDCELPDRQTVLMTVVKQVLDVWQDDRWCEALNAVHAMTGKDIVVDTPDGPIAGRCERIDTTGRLLVRTGERLHALLDGSVRK